MNKAEKFIREHTRNCSNDWYDDLSHGYEPWLTPDQALKAVEIAREEVIEKVCEFLDNDLCCYIKAQDFAIEHQRLENDLKNCLKK
jgi:hypothetical protein